MATAARVVYSHVTKQPAVSGGKACVDAEAEHERRKPEYLSRRTRSAYGSLDVNRGLNQNGSSSKSEGA